MRKEQYDSQKIPDIYDLGDRWVKQKNKINGSMKKKNIIRLNGCLLYDVEATAP